MKRAGNLFDDLASYRNLVASFRRAMAGCGKAPSVCGFFYRLEPELFRLQGDLWSGRYRPGEYQFFTVYDPKERRIAVAPFRDRVVHHAVVRTLSPVFEPVFIHDSYATRVGKGTHAAVRRAQSFIKRWSWYLKGDIAKYFDSVDHEILMRILARKIKDGRLMSLLEKIVCNTPTPGKGLPMGNLTSQFFANVYLDMLDHEVKEGMRVRGYLRYMDDFVLFGRSRRDLAGWKERIESFLSGRLALELKPGGTWINRSSHGLSFLGMRIFPNVIRVRPENRRRSLRRLRRTLEAWSNGMIDEEVMTRSLESIVGHLRAFSPHDLVMNERNRGRIEADPTG